MKQEEREKLVRDYLDGELDSSREREVLHMIAEDPGLREMLRLDRSLTGLRHHSSESVPEGFSDAVMNAVSEREEQLQREADTEVRSAWTEQGSKDQETRILDRLGQVLDRMIQPARITVRPVWVVLLLGFLGAGLLAGWPQNFSPTGPDQLAEGVQQDPAATQEGQMATRIVAEEDNEVWIRFVYVDQDADHIAVAGDFTGWDPKDLNREYIGNQQVWTGVMRVERGEHQYMFIRDGEEWITDPFADIHRDDGFGNENAVLYL